MENKKYLELCAKSTVYYIYFGTDDYDEEDNDEYRVIKIEKSGEVTWKIESLSKLGTIAKSSNIGKKLINYCIENDK